jgi:hypothetical protein
MGVVSGLVFDPVELDDHAARIEGVAADLEEKHSSVYTVISQAVPGLGRGLAAAALGEQLSVWESETHRFSGDLMAHAQYHRSTKNSMLATEDANRASLEGVGGSQAG